MSLYDDIKASDNPIKAYGDALNREARAQRFLMSATLELSPVCNFRCPFCYARQTEQELAAKGEPILRFAQWKRLIDAFADMNVTSLTFTGGECMLHPDFAEIYRYAYEKGFDLSLLSNGSALTPELLALLRECPPHDMYFTVYGATPQTYEAVCGSASFYGKVMKNLQQMAAAGLQFIIQVTIDKHNAGELEQIYELSKRLNVPFRYSASFTAFGRCSAETAEENEVDWSQLSEVCRRIYEDENGIAEPAPSGRPTPSVTPVLQPVIEKGMPCSAGRCSCYINYRGIMSPCVIFDAIRFDTNGKDIAQCWRDLVAACNEVPRLTECTNCLHRSKCSSCLARHYNDTHEFGKPSPHLCYKQRCPQQAAQREAYFAEHGALYPDHGLGV